jgi:hypothetical protein
MKKAIKILAAMRSIAIIVLVAAIGFSMAACKHGGGDPDPNIIKIKDIPSIYVNKVGALMLSTSASEKNYSVYSIETITETSFSFPMKDWISDSSPWDGTGSYSVTIFIFEDIAAARDKDKKPIYTGVIPEKIDITERTTTLEWSSFVQKAVNFQYKIVR